MLKVCSAHWKKLTQVCFEQSCGTSCSCLLLASDRRVKSRTLIVGIFLLFYQFNVEIPDIVLSVTNVFAQSSAAFPCPNVCTQTDTSALTCCLPAVMVVCTSCHGVMHQRSYCNVPVGMVLCHICNVWMVLCTRGQRRGPPDVNTSKRAFKPASGSRGVGTVPQRNETNCTFRVFVA